MKSGSFWQILKVAFAVVVWLGCLISQAAIINVTTSDNYTKIESANPGDEVVIAPGTYAFRVHLTKQATPTNPIVIRALDPANPPVWDFGSTLVENAPGSYTAGDRGRGGWQFSGARNYRISGIVFRNCRTASRNSAGIRYYNTTTNLYIKDCVFHLNDNGLTGGTQNSEATVEFCEFNANGNTNASVSSPTHNIYVYGGYLKMRYCYVHDPVQGQNFHIRCRESTFEYNWFARANSYEGDLMSNDDFSDPGPFTQTMTLRGNVIVQKSNPLNNSQVVAMYNDGALANLTLNVRAFYNTFVGNGANAAFIHVSNADGTQMNAEISDNIISGTGRPALIDNITTASVTGVNNWIRTNATVGTPTSGYLSNSIRSPSPSFRNAAAQDFALATNSVCIGAASPTVPGLPGREYFLNEITNRQWRIRAAVRDLGAFESTSTDSPVGPYTPEPRPRLSIAPSGGSASVSWPLFAQDFQLHQASLTNPAVWFPTLSAYITNASNISAAIAISPGGNLFRLKK
jgi:hypothetical protein